MLISTRRGVSWAWSAALLLAVMTGLSGLARANTLPDGRRYEMVSPGAAKNGGSVMPDSTRARAAADGNAVSFASLAAFGDAIGTGVATDYVSVRSGDPGTSGWTTHAVTPLQDPLSVTAILSSGDPFYIGDYSTDLTHGVFRAWSPIDPNPGVANTVNLYVRSDLTTPGRGAYELLTACPLCDLTSTPLPAPVNSVRVPVYGGASTDFSHVAFEARVNLTSDAPAQPANCVNDSAPNRCLPRAYAWTGGQVELAGYMPPSGETSCGGAGQPACVPAPESIVGRGLGSGSTPIRPIHDISADGRRIFFTVPTDASGTPVLNANVKTGKIYMRTDGGEVDQINASERTDCAGDPTCGGDGVPDPAPAAYAPATYWGTSSDGSRVFFTTGEALTDDAPADGQDKLYFYDTTKPASDPHNLTLVNVDAEPGDPQNDVTNVIGVSDSGHYAYFIDNGQLVAGQPLLGGNRGIFVWHDGAISYIGQMNFDETAEIMLTGTSFNIIPIQARMTPDGRHLLLSAHDASGLRTGYDNGTCGNRGCRELYVYSADTNTLVCASCSPGGAPPTSDTSSGTRTASSAASTTWHLSRAIADDGNRVFFTTAEPLLPEDVNGKNDVYEYDVPTGQLHLISTGTDQADSYFMDASPDGHDVFFITRQQLVGWDTDSSYDMYDARVDGGFPEPTPPPTTCSGPACQGSPVLGPSGPVLATSGFQGAGNLRGALRPRTLRCRRGSVKRRAGKQQRCVKVKHKRPRNPRHAKRAAAHQRRSK